MSTPHGLSAASRALRRARLDLSNGRSRLAISVIEGELFGYWSAALALDGDSLSTDAELLFQLSRGETSAYRALFRRHERAAYRIALSMVRSTWDAEEVVAAAFLELWRKRDAVRLVDGSILPWLVSVVSYCAKNNLRSTLRYRRLLAKVPREGQQPDHADEVARVIDAVEISAEVQAALGELSARDASVLLLCVVQELSIHDAAIALGVPEGTVKSRLSRVKAKLRVRLSAFAPHPGEAQA